MRGFRILLTAAYFLLLVPAGLLGAIAYADYNYLDCPGANQCGDALTVMQFAGLFAVGGFVLLATWWFAMPPSRDLESAE